VSFLYPLGLLGLIGIPILIIVYIIKSKYTEQTVASTYLWTLSERFLKRKRRPSPLAGIISLILQLLAVTVISLCIAHPIITVPNAASEYCFILDGSGSMRMREGHPDAAESRFEAGKDAIRRQIEDAVDGSIFTLISAGDTTGVVYERTDSKEQALVLLDELEPAYGTVDLAEAVGLAQGYFNENASILTYLVTDTSYAEVENLEVINVAHGTVNYSLSDVSHTLLGHTLTVTGTVTAYEAQADLTLELYLDHGESPAETMTVSLEADIPTTFSISTEADGFSSIRLAIAEEDGLACDNEYRFYNVKSEDSYKTLLVSDRPFFLEASLKSLLRAEIDVIKPEAYSGAEGYALYVFDTIDPSKLAELPKDGSVWMINANGSIEGAGYTVQGEVILEKADVLSPTTSSSSATQALMEGITGRDVYVTRFIKCGFYRNFTTLFSYKGNPVVFAGTNELGNRQVVIAFDIHDSNVPLLFDFTALMRNLVGFSFPDMIEKTDYTCGESAPINIIANCDSVRVESPSGEISYLKTDVAVDDIILTEVGEYSVTMTVSGSPRSFRIWSSMDPEECDPTVSVESVRLQGVATHGGFAGKYDPLHILFITLAVLFLADWMVYCYEKYQLR